MGNNHWYRNIDWDENIAKVFEEKLRRARDKSQYLRIQASTIASTHPLIALDLLEKYFALGENFDHAQAHVDRATAYLALGLISNAVKSYEAALEREKVFPKLLTQAYLDLPYLIALHGLSDRYNQAIAMLTSAEERLMFPVDFFKYHTSKAIIFSSYGDLKSARSESKAAIEVAARDHSDFRYHPHVGLVSEKHFQALAKLRDLCDG